MKFTNLILVGLILFPSTNLFSQEAIGPLTESSVVERVVALSRLGKISQLNAAIVETDVLRARSPYDHTLRVEGSHQLDASDKVIDAFGDRIDATNLSTTLQRVFPSGTQAEVGYKTMRQSADSPFITTNPIFDSAWFVGLRQPLLRDSFGTSMRSQIKAAEANADAAQAKSQAQIRIVAENALGSFWTWIVLREDERVAKRGVTRAKDFLILTEKKFRLGTAEKADLYAAQASLASREQNVLLAQERSTNSITQLKNVLLLEASQPISSAQKLGNTRPPRSLDTLLEEALAQRDEMKAAKKEVEAAQNARKSAQSAARPQLDVFTQVTLNNVDSSWDGSAGGAFTSQAPNWVIGGEFALPFENRRLKADRAVAELRERILGLQLKQTRDDIATEVRLAWDSLKAAQNQTKTAIRVEGLQRKKLAEEEKDFHRGRSDAFTVLSYQQDLIASERQALAARAKEHIAQIELSSAIGTLLPDLKK